MSGAGRAPSPKLVAASGGVTRRGGMARGGNGAVAGVLGRESVAEVQRARLLAAMVEVSAERGAGSASVSNVVARSGVSRRTFYEIFEDREDCFLAAFDDALSAVAAIVVPAYRIGGSWRAKVRGGLLAALECLEDDPQTARLLVVESLAAGPRALERRRGVLAEIAKVVELGRAEGRGGTGPPALTAEGVVGGVLSVLHARLTTTAMPGVGGSGEGEDGGLIGLAGPLMGMIVLPYLGPAAARSEIERPLPERRGRRVVVQRDPLRDLRMRLTYRTMRVLMAVAREPGSSNRSLGDAAGIGDQGQVSKLLARLQRLGLVENAGVGASMRGEPNAWHLTQKGSDVHDAIANTPA